MRCTMTTRKGTRCHWPAQVSIGGTAVCEWHVHAAEDQWLAVRDKLPDDVRAAAERDDRQQWVISYPETVWQGPPRPGEG